MFFFFPLSRLSAGTLYTFGVFFVSIRASLNATNSETGERMHQNKCFFTLFFFFLFRKLGLRASTSLHFCLLGTLRAVCSAVDLHQQAVCWHAGRESRISRTDAGGGGCLLADAVCGVVRHIAVAIVHFVCASGRLYWRLLLVRAPVVRAVVRAAPRAGHWHRRRWQRRRQFCAATAGASVDRLGRLARRFVRRRARAKLGFFLNHTID